MEWLVSLRQSDTWEQQERQYRQQKILEVESHVVPRNPPSFFASQFVEEAVLVYARRRKR
jgi:hypothetical protein